MAKRHESDGGQGMKAETQVSLVDVSKHYQDSAAVDRVSLDIRRGEFLTLLGPSGSGKTTLLRMIAGLIDASEGEIRLEGERIDQRPTHERNIGMVFQSLALFPHLDVYGNIAFPLWMRRTPKVEIRRRVSEALDLVRLPQMRRRKIEELSGGQRQRIALARALVYRPALLLLDEPLAALDQKLREEMEFELINLHQQIDITIVNVTHDQKEALRISDRIGVMREGRLEQVGNSVDLYLNPATPFVATFLGQTNSLLGNIVPTGRERVFVPDANRDVRIAVPPSADSLDRAMLLLRAEKVRISQDSENGPGFTGTIALTAFQGNATQFEVDVPELGAVFRVESVNQSDAMLHRVGDRVRLDWGKSDAVVLAEGPVA